MNDAPKPRACFLHDGVMRHVLMDDTGVCDCGEALIEPSISRAPHDLSVENLRLRVENARLRRVIESTEFERDALLKKFQTVFVEINYWMRLSENLRAQFPKPAAPRGRPRKTQPMT